MNVQSGSFVAKALFVIALAVGSASDGHAYAFSDNFDNGVIDATFWATSGDGISESGGTLNLSRNDATDSISSLATFSGHFDLSLDMRASNVVWNDTFHGITLVDAANRGISFGFSKYGNFYSAESTGSGTSYYYGDAFTPGAWYTVRLVGDTGGTVLAYVNGGLAFTRNFSNTAAFSIRLPGMYQDGDGPGIGDSDTTNSSIDNFALSVEPHREAGPVDIPTLSEWATLGLAAMLAAAAAAALRRRREG